MRKLLLISSSRTHGTEFLEHCREALSEQLAGVGRLLFVPYALADHDGYAALVSRAFEPLDVTVDSIHRADDPSAAVRQAEAVFIGGGNSFRLLKTLYDVQLISELRHRCLSGMPYIGSSAGSNVVCPTIRTTNDMPIVQPQAFEALSLVPFQINPHFVDADPGSSHQGETRETRLREYLEENTVPVAAIREGSWLAVQGDCCQLHGSRGMVLFERDRPKREFEPGADLSFLLA